MNTRHHAIIVILILLLGLTSPSVLLAQEMYVDDADPREAAQGISLPLKIIGRGFDNSVDKVSFKLPCNKKNCPDSEDIIVDTYKVISAELIEAQITISLAAPTQTYDIAVRASRGRGGKGTTYKSESPLFTVKLRPNQELLSCGEIVVDTLAHPYLGSCTCQFVWNGDESFLPALLKDCVTSETLFIKHRFRGDENGSSDGSGHTTITAVPCSNETYGQFCDDVGTGNFVGTSVIANTTHRASIRYLDIRFQGVGRGCGSGIESAVSFVLNAQTPDPKIPEPLNRNSFLNVRDIGVFSEDDPLCRGIEIIRNDGYTTEYSSGSDIARDWKVYINDNHISAGSYEQAGAVMLGMMPSESINPPQVVGNSIGAAACGSDYPVGILFGDLTPDTANQINGLVENNVIDMTNGCNNKETGILVLGDSGDSQTAVDVNKNTITGAFLGIDVDCHVADANFLGNNLRGDDSGPTGIVSNAQSSSTQGKPNRISGYTYDTDFSRAACLSENGAQYEIPGK